MENQPLSKGALLALLERAILSNAKPEVIARLQWFIHFTEHQSVSKTCTEYGIARTTFYCWFKRLNEADLSTLENVPKSQLLSPQPPAPHQCIFCKCTEKLLRLVRHPALYVVLITILLNISFLLFVIPQTAKAGSFSPTLLVNTQGTIVIDDLDASSNPTLKFGNTLDESLTFDRTANQFQLSDDLEVQGTISGSNLTVTNNISGSGNLAIEGEATVGDGVFHVDTPTASVGINTKVPNGTFHVVHPNDTGTVMRIMNTNRTALIVGTDADHPNFLRFRPKVGSGIAITNDGDEIGLFVDAVTGFVGMGTPTPEGRLHLNSDGGQLKIRLDAHPLYSERMWDVDIANNQSLLTIGNKLNANIFSIAGSGATGIGIHTTSPEAALEVVGTVSGSIVHATDRLTSSGGLTVDGDAVIESDTSRARLTIRGNGGSASTRAEIRLDRTSAARGGGMFIEGTTGGLEEWFVGVPYNGGSGSNGFQIGRHANQAEYIANADFFIDTAGNVGIGTNSPTQKLEIVGTASGEHLHFGRLLSGSGQTILESTGALVGAANIMDVNGNSTGLLLDSEATNFPILALSSITEDASASPHISFGYDDIFDVDLFRSGVGSLTAASNTGTLLTFNTEMDDNTDVLSIVSDSGSNENKVFRFQANGQAYAEQNWNSGGADFAEWFKTADTGMQPGDLACLDPSRPEHVKRCNNAEHRVVGIVSTNPGFIGNSAMKFAGHKVLVGLIGQLHVNVTGVVTIGDAITLSEMDGVGKATRNRNDQSICVAMDSAHGEEINTIPCLMSPNLQPW